MGRARGKSSRKGYWHCRRSTTALPTAPKRCDRDAATSPPDTGPQADVLRQRWACGATAEHALRRRQLHPVMSRLTFTKLPIGWPVSVCQVARSNVDSGHLAECLDRLRPGVNHATGRGLSWAPAIQLKRPFGCKTKRQLLATGYHHAQRQATQHFTPFDVPPSQSPTT